MLLVGMKSIRPFGVTFHQFYDLNDFHLQKTVTISSFFDNCNDFIVPTIKMFLSTT